MGIRLILASASPRRVELLENLGAQIVVHPADIDEDKIGAGLAPEEMVRRLAEEKAKAVAGALGFPALPIVAADTAVDVDGVALGKPKNDDDARKMLRLLSGRSHFVRTGVAVIRDGRLLSATESTRVTFLPLSEETIDRYVGTGEPRDKAGAYGIQGLGALLVSGIEGDYFSVVGLPLARLNLLLDSALM